MYLSQDTAKTQMRVTRGPAGVYRYSRLSTSISPTDGPATMSTTDEKHQLARTDSLENEKAGRITELEEAEVPREPVAGAAGERSVEEKRLVRKLDMRIMPIACILYLFACASPVSWCL